ncbi:MAG TPA: isoprenylcysteine carboxylmethyltransferase family protein [Terriglobia bacterium]|nr:isoprenylcysteine carboxylmethyltransferase family protein [Terriglobia bacterium]
MPITIEAKLRAWIALAVFLLAIALLIFVPAGTMRYWQAWLYLGIYGTASALTTRYLVKHDPELLRRRMRGGPTAEKRPAQRWIMFFVSIGFVGLLVVPALDHRFGWSSVPVAIVIAGDLLVAVGMYWISRVYRENTFTSATIEVAENQRVISTGPYAIVRHPMYASALLYLVGTPLALGSWWGLVALAVMIPFLLWRLFDEEQLLVATLPGYADYQRKVRRRLIPFVW